MNLVEQFYQKALQCAQVGNFSESLEWVKKMHAALPNNDSVYLVEAAVLMEAEDYAACAEASQKCISLNPNNGSGWNHLGVAECYLGNVRKGLAAFKNAITLGVSDAAANYHFWSSKL